MSIYSQRSYIILQLPAFPITESIHCLQMKRRQKTPPFLGKTCKKLKLNIVQIEHRLFNLLFAPSEKKLYTHIFCKTCVCPRNKHLLSGYVELKYFNNLKSKQKRFYNCHKAPQGVNCVLVTHALLCRQPSTPSPMSKTTVSIKYYAMIHALSCFTVVKKLC